MKTRSSVIRAIVLFAIPALLAACAAMPPKPVKARNFTVPLLQGGKVSLSDYAGKPLVLTFGASWCPHCQHEMPILRKAFEKRKDGVQFLPIFVKSNRKDALALLKKNGMNGKVGWDPKGRIADLYGVTGMPETLFINSRGRIIDDYFGAMEPSDINNGIKELLKSDKAKAGK